MANMLAVLQWLGRVGQKKKNETTLMRTSLGRSTMAVRRA